MTKEEYIRELQSRESFSGYAVMVDDELTSFYSNKEQAIKKAQSFVEKDKEHTLEVDSVEVCKVIVTKLGKLGESIKLK